jgi:hypothetical protein
MKDVFTAADLRVRRQELVRIIANETEQAETKAREAEQHQGNAERHRMRLDEIDYLLTGVGQTQTTVNIIPMRKPSAQTPHTKPILRYRTPGATTDIVMLAYDTPGIAVEQLITTVYDKYKGQGTSRDTVSKMVNRLIREQYAYREGSKIYLTDVCKRAWEASPLNLAS